jgi:putative hemolysin
LSQVVYERLSKAEDREKVLRGTVKWQWAQWGFDVSFISHKAEPLEAPSLEPTDVDKKMQWIKQQVMPSMAYCVDKGYGEQLAMLLNEGSGLLCKTRDSGIIDYNELLVISTE